MPDPSFDPDAPATRDDPLFGLPHSPEEAAVVVVPVPFDATCSYRRGTADAPEAVLRASHQVDLCDAQTGHPWRQGIAMEPVDPRIVTWNHRATTLARPVQEAGGAHDPELISACQEVDELCERVEAVVHSRAAAILDRGAIPAILGGDHSVPFGALRAACDHAPGLGLLHVDAHADLREAYEGFRWSHASILFNALSHLPALGPVVQVGVRDLGHRELELARSHPGIATWFDADLADELAAGTPWLHLVERLLAPLPDQLWISFDADGLDPSLCPGTGTPVPGGLTWHQVLVLLRVLGQSGRHVVGFDLCEVGPGQWDADVGARLLYKLSGWAIATRPTR